MIPKLLPPNNIPLTEHQRAELRRFLKLAYGPNYAKEAGADAGISERQVLRILAGRRGLTPRAARRLKIALADRRPEAIEHEIARKRAALEDERKARFGASVQARQILEAELARRPGS